MIKRCIVIDDEPLAVRLLSSYVERHDQLELVERYTDPIKALHEMANLDIDLIFLDIQMPQLSGIQFLKILNNKVAVILTTAYDEYALESYDYKVVDYLVKPISFDRFSKAVEKFDSFKNVNEKTSSSHAVNEVIDSIFVKSGHKSVRLNLSDILFMESKGDYLHIVCNDEIVKTLENLKDILNRLNKTFIRCHRSFIVNMDKIKFIENNRIVIKDEYIPVSRAYQDQIQRYLNE